MIVVVCLLSTCFLCLFFFFKHKSAYEIRISDWSSDVCSSYLVSPVGSHRCVARPAPTRGRGPQQADGDWRPRSPAQSRERHRRSEERRVGKECVRTCRTRGTPDN